MKVINKKLLIAIVIVILAIVFFSYSPIITYDTSHYLWLENMLTPNDTFANWDVARGIIFPLIIYCSNSVFGHNADGILMLMFIFYAIMITFSFLIFKKINKDTEIFNTKTKKISLACIVTIAIILNPIVFGYYHTLLTEFVAITIAVVACYLSWNWTEIDFKNNKLKYILYTVIFGIIIVFAWHLKQPYVGTALFPVIVAAIVSICREFNWKNILQRIATIIICLITLVISMLLWNKLLKIQNVKISADRESSGFLSSGLINGITQIQEVARKENIEVDKIENYKISQKNKQEIKDIIEGKSKYKDFILYKNQNEKAKDFVIFMNSENLSVSNSMQLVFKVFFTSPTTLIKSYTNNYLCISDILRIYFIGVTPKPTTDFTVFGTAENAVIGLRTYNEQLTNVFPTSEKLQVYAEPYVSNVEPIRIINVFMKSLQNIIILITKISFLILPLVLIICIIINIKSRKKMTDLKKKQFNIVIILLSFSLLHVLLHSTLGAIIDRYTVPAIIPMFIAYIIIFYNICNAKKL